jgi:transcription initiation factor TFIIB
VLRLRNSRTKEPKNKFALDEEDQVKPDISTVIGKSNRDASGNAIEPSMLSTMHRLRTWDFRTQVHTSADRNFRLAFTELDTLKDKLGLPDSIIEKTAYIYRKAQQTNLARGRSVSVILTAAVYIACREAGIPKTLKEIDSCRYYLTKQPIQYGL